MKDLKTPFLSRSSLMCPETKPVYCHFYSTFVSVLFLDVWSKPGKDLIKTSNRDNVIVLSEVTSIVP